MAVRRLELRPADHVRTALALARAGWKRGGTRSPELGPQLATVEKAGPA